MQNKFSERLSELMFFHNLTNGQMAKIIGTNISTISRYRNGKHNIKLSKAILIADYFNCSLDFLFGKNDYLLDFTIQPSMPFYEMLNKIIKEKSISKYKLGKNLKKSHGNFDYWKKGCDPFIDTVIEFANYFDVSIDYFIGRDR